MNFCILNTKHIKEKKEINCKYNNISASTVTSMAASISANCMQLALQWESQESELGLKKEELE